MKKTFNDLKISDNIFVMMKNSPSMYVEYVRSITKNRGLNFKTNFSYYRIPSEDIKKSVTNELIHDYIIFTNIKDVIIYIKKNDKLLKKVYLCQSFNSRRPYNAYEVSDVIEMMRHNKCLLTSQFDVSDQDHKRIINRIKKRVLGK